MGPSEARGGWKRWGWGLSACPESPLPLGSPGFRWWELRMEAQGDGEWDLIFFFSNSRSKNWKMGALAGNGSYKEMRKFAGGYATPSRAREAAGSTSRAGSVDPQSPTLGFLSDHRCTYLESAYHTDTLKSVTFQRKPTRMGAGGGGKAVPPPPSSRVKRPELTSCSSRRCNLAPWGKPHLPAGGIGGD